MIMPLVPLALARGRLGSHVNGESPHLCSQVGLLMLIVPAAKNGFFTLEFNTRLPDQCITCDGALLPATGAETRFSLA